MDDVVYIEDGGTIESISSFGNIPSARTQGGNTARVGMPFDYEINN